MIRGTVTLIKQAAAANPGKNCCNDENVPKGESSA
jgi:hypothetical protein